MASDSTPIGSNPAIFPRIPPNHQNTRRQDSETTRFQWVENSQVRQMRTTPVGDVWFRHSLTQAKHFLVLQPPQCFRNFTLTNNMTLTNCVNVVGKRPW